MASSREKRSLESLDSLYREAIKAPETESRHDQDVLSEDFLSGDVYSADGEADGSYGQVIMHSLAANDPAWHGKAVAIAADRMRVSFKIRGGKPISAYQLNYGLEQLGVNYGIDWPALTAIEEQCKAGGRGEFVVAKGTPADMRQQVTFPEIQRVPALDGSTFWLSDGVKLDGVALRAILTGEVLDRIEKSILIVKAVAAGTILARIVHNPNAQTGMNVLGEAIDPPEDPVPILGDNIRYHVQTGVVEATRYGYLVLEDKIMSVLPPVWVSADHLVAYYVNFTQIGTPVYPTASDLLHSLLDKGVQEGTIRRPIIDKLAERLHQGLLLTARTLKVAEAIAPKAGRNAQWTFSVDMGTKADVIRDDGTIDIQGRNAVVNVKAGTLIAEKVKASKGSSGCNLFGQQIKAEDGVDQFLAIDETVTAVDRDDRIQYYAAKDGNVRFVQKKLAIVDVVTVTGDVDANGGNLDLREDIQINGSILAGFTVRSQGNIAIAGSVYNGARVLASGDLSVGEGIIGTDTKVVVLENLQAVFIQDAEVIVKGDAVIRRYLYNAVLRANGSVTVVQGKDGGQKSGRIIGGVTCASRGIVVSTVGHPGHAGTVLAIQPDPEYSGQLMRLEEEGRNCREGIAKIARSLPFDSFDPAVVKRALTQMPADKREPVVKLLTTVNNLIKRQQKVEALKKEIGGKMASELRNVNIRITQEIFQGSEVHFGDKTLVVSADLGNTTFSLQGGEIV